MDLTNLALYYTDGLPAKERYNNLIDLLALFLQILQKARESGRLITWLSF